MAASKFLIKQETSLTNCANNEKEHTKGTVLLAVFNALIHWCLC